MTKLVFLPDQEVRLKYTKEMTPDDFMDFCLKNPDLNVELEPNGTIVIMSPLTPSSGNIEAEFITELKLYARKNGGEAYSSSTGFTLPDGSVRSPDASYFKAEQLEKIDEQEFFRFTEMVPTFVVEVRSKSDSLSKLQRKMTDTWIANGVRLAWLVDVKKERVFVYRANGSIELVEGFEHLLTGEQVLPGFTFDLGLIKA